MRHLLIFCGMFIPILAFGQLVKVPPRQPVPHDVLKSAKMATQGLADRVVRGEYQVIVDRMYPALKKKEARKMGGMDQFEQKTIQKLKNLPAGVRLVTMKALQPYSAFEVNFGLEERIVNGKKHKIGIYRDWMVFVPTQSIISVTDTGVTPAKIYQIRNDSFQVAISRKGTNQWTFMDGGQVRAFQLRKFFPYLPAKDKDLGLPQVKAVTLGR